MGGKGRTLRRTCLLATGLLALFAATASAEPASGPRETVDQSFTATQPGAPTGVRYSGSYHAAGDPSGMPPYLRRMVFHPPGGFRFDTSVPDRCTATDVELELRGPAACPPRSVIGQGTTEGIFQAPITHSFEIDHFTHHVDVLNNANEQIILVQSEGWTVVRGKIGPDTSIAFTSPTCFPAPPTGQCADDYIVQLGSTTFVPAYSRAVSGGGVRSYATTSPTCPRSHRWRTTISFFWSDGSIDNVVSRQHCD